MIVRIILLFRLFCFKLPVFWLKYYFYHSLGWFYFHTAKSEKCRHRQFGLRIIVELRTTVMDSRSISFVLFSITCIIKPGFTLERQKRNTLISWKNANSSKTKLQHFKNTFVVDDKIFMILETIILIPSGPKKYRTLSVSVYNVNTSEYSWLFFWCYKL